MNGGKWEPKYVATLGMEVYNVSTFSLHDCAGQEKLGGLRDGYYIGANAALVWFDLGSKVTLRSCANWIKDLHRVCGDIPIVLVGNKSELINRKVKQRHIDEFLHSHYGGKVSMYVEMSVKNKEGLNTPLEILSALV